VKTQVAAHLPNNSYSNTMPIHGTDNSMTRDIPMYGVDAVVRRATALQLTQEAQSASWSHA
jgi:hypothetical protein